MKYLFIIVIAFFLNGCLPSYEAPPYDLEFNTTRKKVGLLLIDSTFKKVLGSNKESKYPIRRKKKGVSPFEGMRKPGYLSKYTFLHPETGKIIFEEDVYASGVKETGVEKDPSELVIYRYFFEEYREKVSLSPYFYLGKLYDDNEFLKGKWQYTYAYPDTLGKSSNHPETLYFEQKMKQITKKQADSILGAWKITKT